MQGRYRGTIGKAEGERGVKWTAAVLAGLVTAFGAASAAGAASVSVKGTCFIEQEQIITSGAGFTPGGSVGYAFDGVTADFSPADASGNVFTTLTAPTLDADVLVHTFNLTATDQANPAIVGSVPVTVTKFGASIHPLSARPSHRVKFAIRGMPPGVTIYLHYVLHRRVKTTATLGKPAAPCGTLTVKRRYFPFDRPAAGTWTLQFDDKKHYSSATRPAIRGKVLLFHSSSAAASSLP
jgi:hypothetical protein